MRKYLAIAIVIASVIVCFSGAHAGYRNRYPQGKGLTPGMIVPLPHLGIYMDKEGRPVAKRVHPINLSIPLFIDHELTDEGPLKGKYPDLHLNIRMKPDRSTADCLFLSNAPETLSDENRYLGSEGGGACGIYSSAKGIPPGSRVRILAGHLNMTRRPLKVRIYAVPEKDGVLKFARRGWGVEKSPVEAGSKAFARAERKPLRQEEELKAGVPFAIMDWPAVKPGLALVVFHELSLNVTADLHIVVEEKESGPATSETLAYMPVLHSPKYSEFPDKLLCWGIIPGSPRYQRLMEDFIHARGLFPSPDGVALSYYDYNEHPEHTAFYTLYESIIGTDFLGGVDTKVHNRGGYGAVMRLRINVRRTSDSFVDNYAFLAVNNATPGVDENGKLLPADIGGLFTCRVGKEQGRSLLVGDGNSEGRLLADGEALVLWKGPLKNIASLEASFFPLPNSSARILFAVIPLR
jgi:hypothetical protein